MKPQRFIVITNQQMHAIQDGDIKAFAENMIRLGISIATSGMTVETIQGPYNKDEEDEKLLILNLVEKKS